MGAEVAGKTEGVDKNMLVLCDSNPFSAFQNLDQTLSPRSQIVWLLNNK